MGITERRQVYMPFEYEQAYDYWMKQQNAHWLHTEISMAGDINDWKQSLTEAEKNVIGNTLKGFIQSEIIIGDYWTRRVQKYFPKPEICMMASTFGSFETIHMKSYAYLNESLGLETYDAFLHDKTAKAKLDNMISTPNKSKADIAKSIAVFSAFGEGVSLFSSFAILVSFQKRNLMKGMGKIIEFSIRDESLHSEAGCWLFRTFIGENPDILTDELKQTLYNAARIAVSLEDEFIDNAFELGPIEGIDADDLKQYIRHRANMKLQEIGLGQNWKNVKQDAIDRMEWFTEIGAGVQMQDFFAGRVSDYTKGLVDFNRIWED
jgi:ribonucleoside-diphosphate reductase beta chain